MDTRLTLSDVRGPLTDLLSKLEGKGGEVWLQGLKKFLRKENPWEKPETFRTIEIGTYEDVESLRKDLEESGAQIGTWARDILNKTELSQSKQSLDLVVLSVKELGFPEGAQYQDICKAAESRGLDRCPAEVGAQLRRQYQDQPEGEWLIVAMEPIRDSDGDPDLFVVERDGGARWLSASDGSPDSFWNAHFRFVFVRRQSSHFSPSFYWESFVFADVKSNRLAFFPSHLFVWIQEYIFCRLWILFPKEPS